MENKEAIITDIVDYIDSSLEEDISIDDIAGTFYFNRHYLMKFFKKEMGVTITQYRNYQKVRNSIPDLLYTKDKILKIALTHGFHSLEYYSETFYKVVGMSPIQFRKCGLSLFPKQEEEDMEKTRLQKIQADLAELRNLRNQVLGVETEEKTATKDAPKMLLLSRKDSKKVA